jgi:hypothetical protein
MSACDRLKAARIAPPIGHNGEAAHMPFQKVSHTLYQAFC